MKTALLSVSLVLACTAAPAALAQAAPTVPKLAAATPTAALGTIGSLTPETTLASVGALPGRSAAPRQDLDDVAAEGPGWRERLALLGAAFLALLFILRRQLTQRGAVSRVGHASPVRRDPLASRVTAQPWTDTPAPHAGFTLSAFENLPPSVEPTPLAEPLPTTPLRARRLRATASRRATGPQPRRKVRLRAPTA